MSTASELVILFQGDSITDCGRNRESDRANLPGALGQGYAFLAAAMLLDRHPSKNLTIYNKGISGNKVTDLANRWQRDCLDLKPDVLSILIGVNDTWHGTGKGEACSVSIPDYDATFRQLLDDTKSVSPQLRLLLCVPFTLPCGAVGEHWFPEMTERQEVVKQIAKDYGATLVDFQAMFDRAMDDAGPEYWAGDGVHPSVAGHHRMARTWVEAFEG